MSLRRRLTEVSWAFGRTDHKRRLLWVDGANSAVMAYMELQRDPLAIPVHCDLGSSVHEDSHRFIDDLEEWYGVEIIRIKSNKYDNIDEVFEARSYLSGIAGAPCTGEMKFVPRLDFQMPSDTHLWGYTADSTDVKRFELMLSNYPDLAQQAPLILHGLTKADCHQLLADCGVRRPYVYEIGYPNGNCLGCVKATSPNYWAMTRLYFPEVFARRAAQSRKWGVRLTRIKGVRIFIDEIPLDWPTTMRGQKMEGCGFHCASK